MNTSYTFQEMVMNPVRPDLTSSMNEGNTSAAPRQQESRGISREELALKVLKLTGSVRLSSRSAHHWHHCGINE